MKISNFHAAVLDSINAQVAVIDPQGVIIAVNRAWRDFAFANGAENLGNNSVGLNYFDACNSAEGAALEDARIAELGIRSVLGKLRPFFSMEYPCHSADDFRWFQLTVTPYEGEPGGAVLTHFDVTEGKLLALRHIETQRELVRDLRSAKDAAEAANLSKRDFLAMTSHEIRTPLNSMLGIVDLLKLRETDAEKLEMFAAIEGSSKPLLSMIDDILDFSRIEAGQLVLRTELLSVSKTIDHIAGVYRVLAEKKKLRLDVRLDPNLAPLHWGDDLRIRQIAHNLLSNALKFTDRGGIELRVESIGREPGREQVQFVVVDSGVGVPIVEQANVFSPFTQVNGEMARRRGGAGLGLSICKRLIDAMGGAIRFASTPLVGTTVTVVLPMKIFASHSMETPQESGVHNVNPEPLAPAQTVNSVQAPIAAGEQLSPPLILVADDNALNRSVLGMQLRELGFEVEMAADGVDALGLWKAGAFQILLTDCQMPRMDGFTLAREIRLAERAANTTPPIVIVACTAGNQSEQIELCMEAGMNDFIAKPITLGALQKVLGRWTGRREA